MHRKRASSTWRRRDPARRKRAQKRGQGAWTQSPEACVARPAASGLLPPGGWWVGGWARGAPPIGCERGHGYEANAAAGDG
ncbi:hypothetical protein DENSPDRAFT_594416 [Dentipellis sp. KUC8613]|nr:hypothetical protein DENSPDRAFT_594416 [Dentipellis sp. KUC8613]